MNSVLQEIRKLAAMTVGSEDDLIMKVVIPFFFILGYTKEQIELKYPVPCYRANRIGRKPEADCVFFSGAEHNIDTSLLVVEVKRPNQPPAEEQARFYSANLFVPFYLTWEYLNFEIFQLHNFRGPSILGMYSLTDLTSADFNELKMMLSPKAISLFCEKNDIKRFDFTTEIRKVEGSYVTNLERDLRLFKILDMLKARDLLQCYVPLYIHELIRSTVPAEDVEHEIQEGIHPSILEERLSQTRQAFLLSEALNRSSTLAVVGDPGAGKTMLLKHLCIQHCYSNSCRLPVFIAVRELVAIGQTLFGAIDRHISQYGFTDYPETVREKALSEGRLLLCLDGLDELDIEDPTHARKVLRKLAAELGDIAGRNPENVIVISARRESWPTCRSEIPPQFQEYEISPLPSSSIRALVSNWFGDEEKNISESLIDEFRVRGWPEFVSNPLLLALTCIVYEKRRRLPDRLAVLYQRCVDVLLEEWDATRRISRRDVVHGLTPERKLDLLAEMALSFHTERRSCFSRERVLAELAIHLPKVGLSYSEAGNTFDEISAQHGLLRSWSIEGYYAFPHMVFQEFLTAKALRDRPDGFRELINRKDDPFWHTSLLIFAGMGDATELIGELLQSRDNVLHSSLFLAAECLGTGAKLRDVDLRHQVIHRLKVLTEGEVTFLRDRAIDALASVDAPEALTLLRGLMRDESGQIVAHSYAARHAIKIEGEAVAEEIVNAIITNDYACHYLMDALRWLPQRKAIRLLEQLVTTGDYPREKDLHHDPGIRHRRRSAASLLAEVGEDESIPTLMRLLRTDYLTDFVRAGVVDALASIRSDRVPRLLREILPSDDFPVDCKVRAAHHLGPNEQSAKRYLLSLVANAHADYYDRRDAASALCDFKLSDSDIPAIEKLLTDPNPVFWGGPTCAAKAIAKIGSAAALSSLQRASAIWESSDYYDKSNVLAAIEELLGLAPQESDIQALVHRYLGPQRLPINWDLPDLLLQFYLQTPDRACELFLRVLSEYSHEVVYGGTLAWAIILILPQLPLTKALVDTALDLARRTPKDEMIWASLDQLRKRQDLDPEVREAFYRDV